MSEQPQRRRRRRRSRRPAQRQSQREVEREVSVSDGAADAAAEPADSNDGGQDEGGGGRGNGGRGRGNRRGGGNRGEGGGGGRDRGQPPKRTIFGLPRMSFALLAGLLVALIAMVVMQQVLPSPEVTEIRGIVAYPDQGRRHLEEGETFGAYNSSPPTSGPHHDELPRVGVYGADEPAPFNVAPDPVRMLPLLESGGVVIYYDPAHELADELLSWLRLLAGNRPHLAAVPIEGLAAQYDGAPIVAAAWRTLLPVAAPTADEEEDDGLPVWRAQLEVFLSSGEAGYYERYVLDRDAQLQLLEEARSE